MESEHVLHEFRNFFGIHSEKYSLNLFFHKHFNREGQWNRNMFSTNFEI
jgi:hypothetical protein